MDRDDISQKIYEMRRKGREMHLEFQGIDTRKLRHLEASIDGGFVELAEAVRKGLGGTGGEIAERHKLSRDRHVKMYQKVAEGVISPDIGDLRPRAHCICLSFNLAGSVGNGNDPVVLGPPTGGTGSASVTFDPTGCVSHPMAEARGAGTGTTNSAEITSWCRYSFMPSIDGTYCIRPLVYLNGHYLLWTWGSCSGDAEDLGSGRISAKVTVQVDQLSLPVKTVEHTVLDHSAAGGSDTQSGFAYDSGTEGGLGTSVYLEGGHEAVVWIKTTCLAEVTNHGRAWVDMQTSPQFYSRVDEVRWGRIICFPWYASMAQATPITLPDRA